MEEILEANDMSIVVPDRVATECRLEPGSTEIIVGEPRRCSDVLASGRLSFVGLADDELDLYVELGRELDDGEAAALAHAANRSLVLLTDERKAIRIAAERFPTIAIVRTAALFRRWSAGVLQELVAEVLHTVEDDASYLPNASDPDREWWFSYRDR